ncbi:hypothetical protein LguiB_033302 [Lonicera macranthoides]
MFEGEDKLHNNGDGVMGNMVVHVEEKLHGEDDSTTDMVESKEEDTTNLEPLAGMEFESHGAAYSFYQEYARSIGFNTAIQNSRRSKTSREFIDAKFACSRYGTKREYENKSLLNRPQRVRQGNKQLDHPENASGRRSCAKTDCKASMHVKRRPDGKWIIHRFEKEHNHQLLPAQAVSEQTRKMYAAMARQFAEYKNVVGLKNDSKNPFDKGRNLALEPGEANILELVKQYESILQDRYEEEARADSDTWNKPPALKSPSPFEKHLSGVYSHAVFKKFQVEVLGAVACIPRREKQEDSTAIFRVQDFEKNQDFTVVYNELKSEVSCVCRLFEFKGFLCRHAMIVLQICGLSTIPSQYILKRWMKDAKNHRYILEGSSEQAVVQGVQSSSRVQRYNDLCQRAIRLGEEGSLSQESYNFAIRALEDAFGNCVDLNNSSKNLLEAAGTSASPGLLCLEEDNNQRSMMSKTSKKKNPTKKRKMNSEPDVMAVEAQDSMQQLDKMSSRPVTLDGFFGPQHSMQGVVQLNLMAPSRDNYYGNQQTIQGIFFNDSVVEICFLKGPLSSMAPNHDGFYGTQQTMHGLAQMDFFRAPGFTYGIRDDPNVRSAQLHDDPSRHA